MTYLLGLLTGVVFFVVVGIAIFIGYKVGKRHTKPPDVSEEETRHAEKLRKDFLAIMNYDVDKALERKKVSE